MRNLAFILVLMNLAFFAYAEWIDSPAASPADTAPALPKLLLAAEFPPPPVTDESSAPPPSSVAQNAGPADSGKSAPAAGSAAAAQAVVPKSAAAASSCVAVGPFDDAAGATRAASALKDRGFEPRQRNEAGEVTEGYWVHIENVATSGDQNRLMRSLEQAGLSDASPIQSADQTRHISVGIFSDRGRAERRASAVKRLGIEAQVSPRKRPGTVYWLELQTKGEGSTVSTDGITRPGGEPIEVRACGNATAPPSAPTAKR